MRPPPGGETTGKTGLGPLPARLWALALARIRNEILIFLKIKLMDSGQIQLRRIDGYQRLSEVLEHAEVAA